MAQTPEGAVKAAIKKELLHRGFINAGLAENKWPKDVSGWFYMPVSNGMGVHGIPDFVCTWRLTVSKSVPLFIEAKKPGGDPTANQLNRHAEIRAGGGEVLVVDDVNQLREFFNAYDRVH